MPPKRRKAGRPPGSKNKKTLLKHGRKAIITCDICKKSFDSKATFNQHHGLCKNMTTYDIKKAAFSCQECKKKFRFEDSYKMHLENEHSKSPGSKKCDLCPVTCPNKEALLKHIECYHERDKFNCPHCKKEFARQSHVLRHMSQKGCGGTISLYMCEICNCSFTRKDNLMAHLRLQHIAKDHFKCKQCAYHTKNFSKLIIHQQKTHLAKPLNFECDHCGKMTSSRAAIAKHLEIHGTRKYSCDVCGYSTFTQEVLRRHILTHVQEKPHKCDVCNRSYIQRAQLQRHMVKHNGITCLICGMSFTSKAGIRLLRPKTIAYILKEGTLDMCRACRQPGKSLRACHLRLITHQKCHAGGKKLCCPFENCTYGKKEFANESSLQNHVKWHLEEKPYTCEVCSKRFHSERYMQKHMLTHTLDRPRRCMYCVIARAYARGEQLVRHVRVSHPAVFRDHLTHVRQVLGLNVGTERVKKSELQSILNMLDAESDRILEGYGTGVLYGGLVEQDESISDSTSVNLKNGDGPLMSEEELAENLKKLLLQLIDKETLDIFGWPDEPVDSILEKVIEHCGAKAADREKWSRVQRLRENAKHLFVHAIEDKNITRMLDTHTIDQIIKHFLTQVDGVEDDQNETAQAKV